MATLTVGDLRRLIESGHYPDWTEVVVFARNAEHGPEMQAALYDSGGSLALVSVQEEKDALEYGAEPLAAALDALFDAETTAQDEARRLAKANRFILPYEES